MARRVALDQEGDGSTVLVLRLGQRVDSDLIRVLNDQLRSYMHPVEYARRPHTSREAAAILGISPKTLLRWARQGKIRYWETGRRIRFQGEDIEALRESMRRDRLTEEGR
ncbi:helix-turn-helix domain-containing protein [Kribbella albertanoniae]|uniref:DNA-binding protein n=1 Tax=Kribbella albertanoniae TaxID=1266829 RepID=A0A4R4PKK9_9ACTN|nr:DNA-binding protein [Kribbella albertanoniae]